MSDAMAGDKRSGGGDGALTNLARRGRGDEVGRDLTTTTASVGRRVLFAERERYREREGELKGDRERVQGGAFVSRCDGRGQEEWGGGWGTYQPCEEGEGGQSWEGSDNNDGIGRTTGALRGA